MAADLDKLAETIRALTPEERDRLRYALDAENPSAVTPREPSTEADFEQRLLRADLLRETKQPARDEESFRRFNPVSIQGTPLSETILEERR